MAQDKHQLLQRYWGYNAFRPLQEEIIDSVLQGHDTIALLPTGGGKSLCYQLPALMLEGVCVVVSPLIALMKDQVQQLIDRGVRAAHIVSGTAPDAMKHITHMCYSGSLKLLYVSPERLRQRAFCEQIRQAKVSMIAVDEAHCVSQWGHDFRPPYRQIADFRKLFPQAPLLALTASATPDVLADISSSLQMRECRLFRGGFARHNLAYTVVRDENKLPRLISLVQHIGGSGIVYVRRRRKAEHLAELLVADQVQAMAYHAGLDGRERDRRQAAWMDGRCQVMVATSAFGMGIDKPDVRFVIHVDIPESVEAYYQEAGRAGRDGQRAYAIMLVSETDFAQLQSDYQRSFPPPDFIRNVYRALCNYYRVPIGTGLGARFDFDLQELASRYRFGMVDLYNACRFLQREGLIDIPDREESESTLFVPLTHTDLYHFRVDHPRFGDLLEVVMRMYGGVGIQPVAINESKIGQRLAMTSSEVAQALTQLGLMNAVRYVPRTKKPQIYFTQARIDERDVVLSEQNYSMLKQMAARRIDAIADYVRQHDTCRANWLLSYFGDSVSDKGCGLCDVCSTSAGDHSEEEVEQQVVGMLKRGAQRATDLTALLPHIPSDALFQTVRRLVDEGVLRLDADLFLHVL